MFRQEDKKKFYVDLLKPELDDRLINKEDPLIKVADLIDWKSLGELAHDQFYTNKGRATCPARVVIRMLMLKHLTGLSDRNLVNTWAKRPDWQYFTGMKQLEQEAPFDQSNLCRWRKKLGVAGASKILAELIKAGIKTGLIDKKSLERINVDTTFKRRTFVIQTMLDPVIELERN